MCLTALLLIAGCARPADDHAHADEATKVEVALPKVSTTKPARKTIAQTTVQPGRIEAFRTTPIHAKVAGYVDTLNVDIGDRVTGPKQNADGSVAEPGQVLTVLSAPELDEEAHQKAAVVEQVHAEILQAQAAVVVAESMKTSAEAGLEECRAGQVRAEAELSRSQSEFDRIKALVNAGTVTDKLANEAEFQFRSAEAGVAEVAARLKSATAAVNEASVAVEQAKADLAAVQARLKVAEADRDRVETLRAYLTIRAPFDGIITERHIDPGHLVQPSRSSADQPLFVIIQADVLRLAIEVPEADAGLVESGGKAKITITAGGAASFEGTVARTGWALQSGTRALRCEIDVPNPEGKFRPGMYAQVELTVAERTDVLTLPKSAIVVKDGASYVVTVTADGTIQRVAVVSGIRSTTDIEIVSGLDGSEAVLTANAAAFNDGQKVEVAGK